ncbi:DUF1524 domain-containing protein [Isoptericola variabilis]|uniref:GmrSD restriction endonucleases C-terminal domain-containing protein n=1 Tax=Isoptericola variabilis (strain 225) TaxID=743718 RepID=F6FRQ8_ISOV2|nr:DUF1524 domain-containing protein [Isoptericola variabilis]AEG42999.1 Domain of unknown function DUF1994-containing protein [Isoptericola variabilis 225]TWH30105.1 uncharacterized protein DUF1524 [Isoptericola variabilis J7]
MPSPRLTRRPSFWVGLGGLVLAMLLGAPAGWFGAVMTGCLYLALCAGWGVLTTRTWWGPMPRGGAAAAGGGALVALVVAAALAGGTTAEVPPSEDVAVEEVAPSGSPTPSPSATPSAAPSATPTPSPEPSPTEEPSPAETAEPGTALATVALLEVKGRAPKTGYDRDQFGQRWADVDRNGCDQRNDVLRRDLTDVVTKAGTHGCVVLRGTFADPYSGETMPFERGEATSPLVQIDHVVALSDAWQKGAQQWTADERQLFANDPLNLLASKGELNQQKGDGDTATWLPPNKAFRCAYVARQVAVKHAYGLWVTQAERDAMERVLSACPSEPLPAGDPSTPAAALMPERAEQEAASGAGGATSGTTGPATSGTGSAVTGGDPACPVKGNHSSSGDWIYHVPSGRYYDVTKPEECFATPAEAEAAGYRASKQ